MESDTEESESIADKVMRTVWVPWQRERRLVREHERIQATRRSACLDAGYYHAVVMRCDGGVACWGSNDDGQAPPDGVDGDFIAIAAGPHHSLALRRDGSVACWGKNSDGQAHPAGVDGDFIAISAGSWHSLALRRDGSIACWGDNVLGCAPTEEDDTARLNSTPFMTEVHVL